MVAPKDLCIGSPPVCGFAGQCDIRGRCCRTICAGPSTADLFPKANQPRDGASIDPINMPWTPKHLDQQWKLTSMTGQISVSSLESPDMISMSKYLSEAAPGIRETDKQNMVKWVPQHQMTILSKHREILNSKDVHRAAHWWLLRIIPNF